MNTLSLDTIDKITTAAINEKSFHEWFENLLKLIPESGNYDVEDTIERWARKLYKAGHSIDTAMEVSHRAIGRYYPDFI